MVGRAESSQGEFWRIGVTVAAHIKSLFVDGLMAGLKKRIAYSHISNDLDDIYYMYLICTQFL